MNTKDDWSDVFCTALCREGSKSAQLAAVTVSGPGAAGLLRFSEMYPERYFDVGAKERHAVTFCADLSSDGRIPVFAVKSSVLPGWLDQVIYDVCMKDLHVIFAVGCAGIEGPDTGTYPGVFDLSYLSLMPNMTVLAPKNRWELEDMLHWAVHTGRGPAAIRYPAGTAWDGLEQFRAPVEYGRWEVLYDESDICLLAVGSMVETAYRVRDRLKRDGANCSLINCRFVRPLDEEVLRTAASEHQLLVTLEENVQGGGFGQSVVSYLKQTGCSVDVEMIALEDEYIADGYDRVPREESGIGEESIFRRIQARMIGLIL